MAQLREADAGDGVALAQLRWAWRVEDGRTTGADEQRFVEGFASWWAGSKGYVAVVAEVGSAVVGMGFLAVVGRVPEPGALHRCHGDLQSVYVEPSHRNQGIGEEIVRYLVERASALGCVRVTVHSSGRAVPLYQRLGLEHSDRLLMQRLHG